MECTYAVNVPSHNPQPQKLTKWTNRLKSFNFIDYWQFSNLNGQNTRLKFKGQIEDLLVVIWNENRLTKDSRLNIAVTQKYTDTC